MSTAPSDPTPNLSRDINPRTRGLFLKNLAEFQTELARLQAAFIPAMGLWQQRKEFPGQVFRSIRRVQDLRGRVKELNGSLQEMHLSRTVAARDLLDALCDAPSIADFYATGVVLVHGLMIEAIDFYLKSGDNLYDQPSVPLLEADRDELAAQVAWANTALGALADEGQRPSLEFGSRIQKLGAELGSSLRTHSSRGGEPLRESRRRGSLPVMKAALPNGFTNLEYGPEGLPAVNVYADRERYHAINFLQEVQATDSCASMLYETMDMPWDFYFDLSRHMWDESRHAMFGEKKLISLGLSAEIAGLSTKAYETRQTLAPLDRYAALTTQEADAFPTKHVGLRDAVAHGDSVSAMAWSYDISDETQHVRFGARWLPVMIEKAGEPRSHEQVKTDSETWRKSVLAEVYKPAAVTFNR